MVSSAPASADGSFSHLVNLAITDTSSARESAVEGESDGSRSDSTARSRRREGRAGSAGEGGNAAKEGGQSASWPQLAQPMQLHPRKFARLL